MISISDLEGFVIHCLLRGYLTTIPLRSEGSLKARKSAAPFSKPFDRRVSHDIGLMITRKPVNERINHN